MKLFLIAALLAVVAAAPSSIYVKHEPTITIASESDVRNLDGSSRWSYAGSDGTTREESNVQKNINYESGNVNQGSSYYISPEGERIALTWVADENGFQPKGDHLPTPPPIPKEIADILPLLPKLQEPVYEAQTYKKY